MKIAVRGFAENRRRVFEDVLDTQTCAGLDGLVIDRTARMAAHPRYVIEIEFLDVPDWKYRFFRFGTDPTMMTHPIATPKGRWVDLAACGMWSESQQ